MWFKKIYLIIIMSAVTTLCAASQPLHPAITTPIPISEIDNYSSYPESIKKLIESASDLSKENLTYLYGSADPKNKGMDCSGTIYYLLKNLNVHDVPRDSRGMYAWAEQKGKLYHVTGTNPNSLEFSNLKPGDLLFWAGTYGVKGNHTISHVMMYLGTNLKKEILIFGSSNGRDYQGKEMWGVSVFSFHLPNDNSAGKFVGYSCIPNLTCKES